MPTAFTLTSTTAPGTVAAHDHSASVHRGIVGVVGHLQLHGGGRSVHFRIDVEGPVLAHAIAHHVLGGHFHRIPAGGQVCAVGEKLRSDLCSGRDITSRDHDANALGVHTDTSGITEGRGHRGGPAARDRLHVACGDTWRITGGLASAIRGWVRVEETVRSPTRKVATAGRDGARLSMRRMVSAFIDTGLHLAHRHVVDHAGNVEMALPPGALSVKRNSAPGSILSMGATEKRSIFRPGGGAVGAAPSRRPMPTGSA